MATNIFVYWSDGLGGGAFDHHSRNGGRGICHATKIACRAGHLSSFFKRLGFARGGCSRLELTRTLGANNLIKGGGGDFFVSRNFFFMSQSVQ